jgi:hypothetical protein
MALVKELLLSWAAISVRASYLVPVGMWHFDDPDDPWKPAVHLDQEKDRLYAHGVAEHDPAGGRFGGALYMPPNSRIRPQRDRPFLHYADHQTYKVDRAKAMPSGLPVGNSAYTIAAWIKPESKQSLKPGGTVETSMGIVGWGRWGKSWSNGPYNGVTALMISKKTDDTQMLRNIWFHNNLDIDVAADDASYLNVWNHVACSYDGFFLRICYWNGVEIGSDVISEPHDAIADSLIIGAIPTCPSDRGWDCHQSLFEGWIDDVGIYDTALSLEEIQMSMGTPTPPPTLAPTGAPSLGYWSTLEEFVIEKKDMEHDLPPNRAHWGDTMSPPRAFDKCPGCFKESITVASTTITPKTQFYAWPQSPQGGPSHDPQVLSIRKSDVWQTPSKRSKPSDCFWVNKRQKKLNHYEVGAQMQCSKMVRSPAFIIIMVFGVMAVIGGCFFYGYQMWKKVVPPKRKSGVRRRCEDCIQAKTKPDASTEEKYPASDECPCCGAPLGHPRKTTAYEGPDYSMDMF